jgi:tetratricopeptide (TPR) repeat protein
MSIDDDLQKLQSEEDQSITEINRALELFTDRIQERRHFASYLNDDPPRKTVLFFHGDGGNGKSWLIRMLRERYCRRLMPESWTYVKSINNGKEFIQNYESAEGAIELPCAYLDFGDDKRNDNPRLAFDGLVIIRKQLGEKKGLRFPLFDFALALYQIKGRGQPVDSLKGLFPVEEASFVDMLINCMEESKTLSRVTTVIKLFSKHAGKNFALYLKKRKIDESSWQELEKFDPQSQLFDQLPILLAKDLNAAMEMEGASTRVILMFDTHESFWGTGRLRESSDSYHGRDEWFRKFLRGLDMTVGIVVLVAGREPPRWDEAPGKTQIPKDYFDTRLVGYLSTEDAVEYLDKAGVKDSKIQKILISISQVEIDQIHPLYLGLCGDIVLAVPQGQKIDPTELAGSEKRNDKLRILIDRLLRYCDQDLTQAVTALAVARAFDRKLFFALGNSLHFFATEATFRQLVRFSFIWPIQGKGEGYFRVHDLLRRALWKLNAVETAQADAALEVYYREQYQQGDEFANVSAIYHANRQDWQRGYDEWQNMFNLAMKCSQHALCESLMELRKELRLDTDFAMAYVAYLIGKYAQSLARYKLATTEFNTSIEFYNQELLINPEQPYIHNNLGNALTALASLMAEQSEYESSKTTYIEAIESFDVILKLMPDDVYAYNNRGLSLELLADLLTTLSEYKEAKATYLKAIDSFDTGLKLAPEDINIRHNLGSAFKGLADLLIMLSEYEIAKTTYHKAIDSFDNALKLAPDTVQVHNSRGNALQGLGALLEHDELKTTYHQAIESFDRALKLAPDDVSIHNNRGNALAKLSYFLAKDSENEAATLTYNKAIESFDTALKLAPEYIAALNNRGYSLQRLAELTTRLSNHQAAKAAYYQAIESFECVLNLTSKNVVVQKNMGETLKGLADLHSMLSEHEAARVTYEKSIKCFDTAVSLAPDNVVAQNNQGSALLGQGALLADLSEYEIAKNTYQKAIESFERVLKLRPEAAYPYHNLGNAFLGFGVCMAELSDIEETRVAYTKAIESFDKALILEPNDVSTQYFRDTTQQMLADLPLSSKL